MAKIKLRYLTSVSLIITIICISVNLKGQITPNDVDSLGLKQGMWREFIIPINYMNTVCIKVPKDSSQCIYLSKDKDRKYFPIVECVGEYKDGLKTGIWFEYYGNGNIKSQIEYNNGIPHGDCKYFSGNGILITEFTISSDDSVSIKAWEDTGAFILEKKVPKNQVIRRIYEE